MVRAARIVHHHEEGAVEVFSYCLLIETLRGILLSLTHLLAVLITESVGKLLHGLTQCKAEHVVYLTEHLLLASLDGSLLLAQGYHLADLQAILTELAAHQTAHLRGIIARISLWLRTHRHQSILGSQVGNTAEGTTIIERILEEELHLRILNALLAQVNDALKHQVGFLQLIVEEEIIL